jgi:SPP1 family predicted phage head-tail adaptor
MPKIARTSDLTERISFYKPVSSKDANGHPVKNGQPFYSCWAAVRTQYLSEVVKNYGTELADSLRMIVRYQREYVITNDMTIEWRGDTYKIIALNPDSIRKEWDTILAKKVS